MDSDYSSEMIGRRRIYQHNASEDRRLEMKQEQLTKEQKLASKSIEKEKLEFHRKNTFTSSNTSLRSNQPSLSDSEPIFDSKERSNAGSSLSSFSESNRMLRTYSLKEHWLKKKTSESTSRTFSILEEDRKLRHRQKSMSSLCTSASQLSLIEDESESPEWHRSLVEKIKRQKFQQGFQEKSAEITARVTGCASVNTVRSNSTLEEPKKSVCSHKPSYMQTTVASRARLN